MTTLFTTVALTALAALCIFQLALILGAPLGKFAWGGANRVLPIKFRVASSVSIALYIIFSLFLVSKAGWLDVISDSRILDISMWVFSIYFLIGIAMNAVSRSKPERYLMTPVAAILAVSFLIVTLS
ncbi:MAG: hypothetical protein V4678_01635 [Patescibacteria group bacterium]